MKHELQFNDGGADWCIHCGTFSCYIVPGSECSKAPAAKFDTVNSAENFTRLFAQLFGEPKPTEAEAR